MLTFQIKPTDHCRRVESFLQNLLPQAPLSYLKRVVKSGHLAVNGEPASPDTLLRLSDRVTIKESLRTRELLAGKRPELDVLYEDERIVVFNKPPGLPVHRTAEDGGRDLVQLGERYMLERGIQVKLYPVNRLDRGTSGAVIMAKSSTSAGIFGRLVKEGGLSKLYLAVVEGEMAGEGSISAPLGGKESETRYRVLCRGEGEALVLLAPVTGRMHQIRKHLQLIGHPIRGDRRYGGSPLPGYDGHPLHSFRLALRHPDSGEGLTVCAPLPEGLLALIERVTGPAYPAVLQALPDITEP